jgi:Zn/Cd-binding protein ZinT
MTGHIVAAEYQGGWVEVYTLLEDGTVEKTFHEGGSEEAIRIREGVRQGGAA